jgi:hypothetical protein
LLHFNRFDWCITSMVHTSLSQSSKLEKP